jgi:AbrB family looped-hinge helix DNA binding protein
MKKINLVFVLVVAFALFVCVSGVVSATIYVPDDFAKIQWAVDNVTVRSTIIVRDGTYNENVDVNKQLTIKSENGSGSTIVQAANPNDHVFIYWDWIMLSMEMIGGGKEMTMKSIKVNKNYQLTIPKEIRKEIVIQAGDEMEMLVNEKKEIIICKLKKRPLEDSFGIWAGKKSGVDYVNEIRDEAEQRLKEKGIE